MVIRCRRELLICLVAGLLVTAGCMGSGGSSETTATNTTPTATEAPTQSGVTEDGGGSDSANTSDTSLSTENVEVRTVVRLEDAGSYTETISTTLRTEGEEETIINRERQIRRIDTDAQQGLESVRTNDTFVLSSGAVVSRNQTEVTYSTPNESYQRSQIDETTVYNATRNNQSDSSEIRPLSVTEPAVDYHQLITPFDWEFSNATTVDGEPMQRYELSAVSNMSIMLTDPNESIVSATGSLLLTADGAVERIEITYSVVQYNASTAGTAQEPDYTVSTNYTLDDLGETTVSEPTWLSDAPPLATVRGPS